MEILCERDNARQKTLDNKTEDNAEHEKVVEEQKLTDGEEKLILLLEQRLQFLLLSLTKLFLGKSPVHNKKEYAFILYIIINTSKNENFTLCYFPLFFNVFFLIKFQARDACKSVQAMLRPSHTTE